MAKLNREKIRIELKAAAEEGDGERRTIELKQPWVAPELTAHFSLEVASSASENNSP